MNEDKDNKKLVLRFVIALGLAFLAGVLNLMYLNGGQEEDFLAYNNDVKPGQTLSEEDFRIVSLPIPRGNSSLGSVYSKVFRTPEERSILVDSKAVDFHVAGELVLKNGTKADFSPPPEYWPFGEFLVLNVNGNSITVKAERDEKNLAFTERTNRLIQITSSANSLSGFQVVNVVELAGSKDADAESRDSVPNDDELDFVFGDDENEDGGKYRSRSDYVSDVDKITVELPKTCRISPTIKRGTKVAFVVPAVVLTDRERNGKSK